VHAPTITKVSIGSSSYEYGTKLTTLPVTISKKSGYYEYGPTVADPSWTFSGTVTGFSGATFDGSKITLNGNFVVGQTSSLKLDVSGSYTYLSTIKTATTKMGNATDQKLVSGTTSGSGTFNPTGVKYVYWATSTTTATPTSWKKYSTGTTSITDLQLSCKANEYIWVACTDNKTNFYAWNDASGKYNTDPLPTTKTGTASIVNAQEASVSGYYLYRTTNAMLQAVDTKFKLA